MSIKIKSQEVNLLVYSYLLEAGDLHSGLSHTAFVLANEASLMAVSEEFPKVSPGALLSLLERALLMGLLEAHLEEDVTTKQQFLLAGQPQCDQDFGLLQPHVCQYSQFAFPPPDLSNGLPPDTDFVELTGHEALISHLLARDSVILTGSQDGQCRLWRIGQSLADSAALALLPHVTEKGTRQTISRLEWSPRGKVASLTNDGLVRLWSSVGEMLDILNSVDEISNLRWNPAGDVLLTASKGGCLQAWDYKGNLKQTFKQTFKVTEIDWQNNSEFATGSEAGDVLIWNLANQQPLLQLSRAKQPVDLLKWAAVSYSLAWIQGSCVRLWSDGIAPEWGAPDCTALDWLGRLLVTGHSSGCLIVWDKGAQQSRIQPHSSPVSRIKVRDDGEFLATLAGPQLAVWSTKNWTAVKRLTAPSNICDLAWTSEGTRLAFAYSDKVGAVEFAVMS